MSEELFKLTDAKIIKHSDNGAYLIEVETSDERQTAWFPEVGIHIETVSDDPGIYIENWLLEAKSNELGVEIL